MIHHKCDRLVAQLGDRPDNPLCGCREKAPATHAKGGCRYSGMPGMKMSDMPTCAVCRKRMRMAEEEVYRL